MAAQYAFVMKNLTKTFPGANKPTLNNINLQFYQGAKIGIVGPNGAGKSTLIKIPSGAATGDTGTIEFDGKPAHIGATSDAMALGIATVYQEPQLFGELTVAENIFLGHEKSRGGLLRRGDTRRAARALLARLAEQGSLPLPFYPSFQVHDDPSSGISEGVAPPRFHGMQPLDPGQDDSHGVQAWIPLAVASKWPTRPSLDTGWLTVVGRIKAGLTTTDVERHLTVSAARIAASQPATRANAAPRVRAE